MFSVTQPSADSLDEVVALFEEYQRFYGVEKTDRSRNRRFLERFVDPKRPGWLLVGMSPTGLAGFALLEQEENSVTGNTAVLLSDLFVTPSARGRGLARELINQALRIANEEGAIVLRWFAWSHNEAACELYDSLPSVYRDDCYMYKLATLD